MSGFYVNVNDLMEHDRVERLEQLPIIHVSGRDCDYYERSEFNRLHPMV